MKVNNIEQHNNNQYSYIFLAILFLAVSNFMLLGAYILLAMTVIYFIAVKRLKIVINKSVLPLVLFSISYFIIVLINGESLASAFKIFVLPLIWLMSYSEAKGKNIQEIEKLFIVLSFGMAIHGIINYLYNLYLGTNLQRGLSFDFWSGTYSASTAQAINFTLVVALAFWMIFLQRKSKFLAVLAVIVFVISTIYDVSIGGRTFLVLIVISLGLSALLYFIHSFSDKNYRRRIVPLILLLIVVIILGIHIFENNIFGIKSIYEHSYLYIRFTYYNAMDLTNNERFFKKLSYITNASKYLFGGNNLSINEGFGYAHELWLDIYDDAGIIPYVMIVWYTISSSIRFIKVAKDKKINPGWRIAVMTLLVVIMLQFFVEPILLGSPMLLYSYILMDASLARFLYVKRDN